MQNFHPVVFVVYQAAWNFFLKIWRQFYDMHQLNCYQLHGQIIAI